MNISFRHGMEIFCKMCYSASKTLGPVLAGIPPSEEIVSLVPTDFNTTN